MAEPAGVYLTINWLAGILLSIVIIGGGAWLTYVQNQISTLIFAVADIKARLSGIEATVVAIQHACDREE